MRVKAAIGYGSYYNVTGVLKDSHTHSDAGTSLCNNRLKGLTTTTVYVCMCVCVCVCVCESEREREREQERESVGMCQTELSNFEVS